MSNREKAAEVIRAHGFDPCREPECIAQDLADAGLLAPDTPEPNTHGDWELAGGVTVTADDGEIIIARHDLERVTITRPGSPEPQVVTMARREPVSTLNEELRRLTPDLVYQEVLATLLEEPVND